MTVAMIRPLQRPVPLRQSVYDALIDLIVGGELPPGQHMVETDLARQLGVSRQPIREALHRMEAEGWVDLRPSQGAFVHVPTDSEVDELLDVRALLEAETARLAAAGRGAQAPQARQAKLARLREICAEGQAAAEADDFGGAPGSGRFRLSADRDEVTRYHRDLGFQVDHMELSSALSRRLAPGPAPLFEEDCLLRLSLPSAGA